MTTTKVTYHAIDNTSIRTQYESWRCGDGCCVDHDYNHYDVNIGDEVVWTFNEYCANDRIWINGVEIEMEGNYPDFSHNRCMDDAYVIEVSREEIE